MKKIITLLLLLAASAAAQISGAGQLSCSGSTVTGTAITSGTSNNTVVASFSNTPAYGVLVQLDQTTTVTGGAVTLQVSSDGGTNYITAPVAQVLNPSTGAQLTNPYTLVASTNQAFLVVLAGASNFQVKLTTAMTGSGTITPYITALCTQPTIGPLVADSLGNLKTNATNLPTTVDTNSGTKSASTLRVVLATDQPALTNKLLVTPDSVALPANQSVNVAQFGGNTAVTGTGAGGTGIPRVTVSNDSTVGLVAGTANVGGVMPTPTTASAQAVSACNILSGASTNSTSCKGSAGNFYGLDVINTTTTIYYLRLYNSSSAPTCSSATGFIRTIPVPPAAASGQAGGVVINLIFPTNYGTGIGYCITGGSSSTDNTNAATGIFGEIRYE